MKRTHVQQILGIIISTCLISTSASAGMYQNPDGRSRYSHGQHGMRTFTNYADYARAVRTAPSRFYNFPTMRKATGGNVFIYDPRQLSWAAYDSEGSLVRTGPGSAGSDYCSDLGHSCYTQTGTFHVYSKQGQEYTSKIFPMPYGGAPMPYAMFFHGGAAIHGSSEVMEHNASHGCVRVLVEDAEWLNHSFLSYGSTVIIKPY